MDVCQTPRIIKASDRATSDDTTQTPKFYRSLHCLLYGIVSLILIYVTIFNNGSTRAEPNSACLRHVQLSRIIRFKCQSRCAGAVSVLCWPMLASVARRPTLSPHPIPATINEIASQRLIRNEREITFIGFIGSLCLFITFGENISVLCKPVETCKVCIKSMVILFWIHYDLLTICLKTDFDYNTNECSALTFE